jgi:hypothetical protein
MATEGFAETIVAIKRTQAERGVFKKYLDYQELCLSPTGYSPGPAMAAIAPFASDDLVAMELNDEAREHRKYWDAAIKARDSDASGADGPPVFEIHIAPWAAAAGKPMDGATLRIAVSELVERGWTLTPPPEDQRDSEDLGLMSWAQTALKRGGE